MACQLAARAGAARAPNRKRFALSNARYFVTLSYLWLRRASQEALFKAPRISTFSPTGANIAQKDEICSFCSYISCTVKIDESTLPEQSHLPTTPPNLKYFGLEQRTTPEEQSAVDQSFLTTSFARVLTLCCKRPVTSTSHSGNSQKG
jgi:hypothetical protein